MTPQLRSGCDNGATIGEHRFMRWMGDKYPECGMCDQPKMVVLSQRQLTDGTAATGVRCHCGHQFTTTKSWAKCPRCDLSGGI